MSTVAASAGEQTPVTTACRVCQRPLGDGRSVQPCAKCADELLADPKGFAAELQTKLASLEESHAKAEKRVDELRAEVERVERVLQEGQSRLSTSVGIRERLFVQIEGLREQVAELPKPKPKAAPPTTTADENRVLDVVMRFVSLTAKDLASFLSIRPAEATKHLEGLVKAGLLVDTGAKFAGQKMYELAERPGEVADDGEGDEDTPLTLVTPMPEVSEAVKSVRDWVCAQPPGEPFGMTGLILGTGLGEATIREGMQELVARGIATREEDAEAWSYVSIRDEGEAARRDSGRRKQHAAREIVQARTGPVAGTGRGFKAANQEVQKLVDRCVALGAEVRGGGKHISVSYNGRRITIASTPANQRTVLNDKSRLRRILGLPL